MNVALIPVAPRLRQLVLLLSSDQPGEIVAAATAITRTLRGAGADWHILADAITTAPAESARRSSPPPPPPPPPPRQQTWACVNNPKQFLDRLKTEPWPSAWESEFVTSIRAQLDSFMPRELSSKQRAVLDRLVRRAVEHGVGP